MKIPFFSKEEESYRTVSRLYELVDQCAVLYRDRPVFVYHDGIDTVTVTYGEFKRQLDRTAEGMKKLGLAGKRVAVIGETSVDWILTYLATVANGGVIVPLDKELSHDEILKFIVKAKVSAVAYSAHFSELFHTRAEEIPDVTNFFALRGQAEEGENGKYMTFRALTEIGEAELCDHSFNGYNTDPEEMCAILFTSGTTGSSKGVMLSQKNICFVLNGIVHALDVRQDDVLMSVLPIHHTYELTCGILGPMMFGASVCISDGLRYVAKNIKEFRPTLMTLVPLFVNQLHKNIWKNAEKQGAANTLHYAIKISKGLRFARVDLRKRLFSQVRDGLGGRLRLIIVGGAALNPDMVREFTEFGVTTCQGYGITECAPLISVVPTNKYNPDSCGLPIYGLDVQIEKENEWDSYGEICVKGDNVMLGYYGDPEQTAEVITPDGWFHTGDYGYQDEKGYLYITGRKKNVIVLSGGKNVFPEEIEEYLEPISLISEAVVVGKLADDGETVLVTALVYPNAEEAEKRGLHSQEELWSAIHEEINRVNRSLPNFKKIQRIEIRTKPFNKTTSMKIKRQGLAQDNTDSSEAVSSSEKTEDKQ